MATRAQIEANRRNAKESTGPRTSEGKRKSRMNALKHGCRSNQVLLPDDDPAEYEALVSHLREALQPAGPEQEAFFQEYVKAAWLIRRGDLAEIKLNRQYDAVTAFDLAESIHDACFAAEERQWRAYRKLQRLQANQANR